jgi:segregation and condensation protein B
MTETESQATENDTESSEAAEIEAQSVENSASSSEPDEQALKDVDPLRLLEALLFAATAPMTADELRERMPDDADVGGLLGDLKAMYANRGVHLVEAGGRFGFQTAADLSGYLRVYVTRTRKLSRAAVETMAIVAYHQPITRAEIEEIRGVALSKGTLDQLFEAGWIHPKGRRETPGRPVTWASTDKFLTDFGLDSLDALPGLQELKAAGLLDKRPAIQISEGLMGEGAEDRLAVTPLAAAEGTLEAAEMAVVVEENLAMTAVSGAEHGDGQDNVVGGFDGDEDDDDNDSEDDEDEGESEDDDEFEDDEDEDEDEDDDDSSGEDERER